MTASVPDAPEVGAPQRRKRKWLISCCSCCGLALLLPFLLMFSGAARVYLIPSPSNEPTLHGGDAQTGDHVMCSDWPYRWHPPRHGDLVVFLAPARADGEHTDPAEKVENILVKRVMGVPGDKIEVKEGVGKTPDGQTSYAVYRNGQMLVEPYIKEPMEPPQPGAIYGVTKPIVIGRDEYFVMGDNRNDSNDSRYWGTLERKRIKGKVTAIVAPAERARSFP